MPFGWELRYIGIRQDSRHLSALSFDVKGVERLARGDEEPIAFKPAKTEVGGCLRQVDLADQIPIRREYVDPVTTVTRPTCAGPEIAVDIAADAIGHGWSHVTEDAAIRQPAVVLHIVDQNLVRMIRFM